MSDEDIDTSDIPEVTAEMFSRGTWRNRSPVSVTLSIDPVVLAWFKARGEDWERHVGTALHDYLMAHLDDAADPTTSTATKKRS